MMKILLAIALTTTMLSSALAETISSPSTVEKATIVVKKTSTIRASLNASTGPMTAGLWTENEQVATVQVDVLNASFNDRPAARWLPGGELLGTDVSCKECRDVGEISGGGVMPLRLTCANAYIDSFEEWQYPQTGTTLTCSIATSRTGSVAGGQYTISIEAGMRTE